MIWLEEAQKLVSPLSYYAQKNPQEVFFLETLDAFKNGFQQLEKKVLTLIKEYFLYLSRYNELLEKQRKTPER